MTRQATAYGAAAGALWRWVFATCIRAQGRARETAAAWLGWREAPLVAKMMRVGQLPCSGEPLADSKAVEITSKIAGNIHLRMVPPILGQLGTWAAGRYLVLGPTVYPSNSPLSEINATPLLFGHKLPKHHIGARCVAIPKDNLDRPE